LFAVGWCRSIQSRRCTPESAQFLAGVVSADFDVEADSGALRIQLDFLDLGEFDFGGIVFEEAEVMDGVVMDGLPGTSS
jgi:hypothetical protein